MFLAGVFVCYWAEQNGNPDSASSASKPTPPLRRRAATWRAKRRASALRLRRCSPLLPPTPVAAPSTACTTALRRWAGLVPLFNIQTGEVIFGGVGAGLYGILLYAIVAVFIAGLMVGRTPEYVGKKIEQKEVKMAMLALIATAFSILVFAAISTVVQFPRRRKTPKATSCAELLESARARPLRTSTTAARMDSARSFTPTRARTGNNGSAFAGLNANTPWYNLTLGLAMLIGPLPVFDSAVAAAGSLARKEENTRYQRDLPHAWAAVCGPAGGNGDLVGALTFFPGARAWARSSNIILMQDGKLFSMLLFPSGANLWRRL